MRDFYKSLRRLLFFTLFLLLIAWVALKLMQTGGDLEKLMEQGQVSLNGLGEKVMDFFQRNISPVFDDLVRRVQGMFNP